MTYLANEHTDLYYSIVNAAILRVPQSATRREAKGILSYTERHHIIPKSMGGTDDYTNLVWLTAEEHLRVHLLLPKMVSEDKNIRKMTLAAVRMANPQSKTQKRIIGDNLIPEIAVIRKEAALLHSKYMSEKHQGSNNPFYGKKHTEQTKERQRIASANRVMTDQMRINYSNGRKTFYKNYPDRKPTGEKNPRFIDTVFTWENINTGELLNATRLEMTTKHPELKSNISQVINGKYSHVKGWRIVNPR